MPSSPNPFLLVPTNIYLISGYFLFSLIFAFVLTKTGSYNSACCISWVSLLVNSYKFYFLLFNGWIKSHHIMYCYLIIHLLMDIQIVSDFLSLQAIIKHPYMYMMLLFSGGRFPKMGLCVLNFKRHCQIIFQKHSLLYSFIFAPLLAMTIIGIYDFGKNDISLF